MARLSINGHPQQADVDPDTPLLWVLRDTLGLTGTRYGCGIARCGACTVHIDGVATRSSRFRQLGRRRPNYHNRRPVCSAGCATACGLRAEPYEYGAPEAVALELYLMKRSEGMPLETPGVRP
jgi:hypothetical protein